MKYFAICNPLRKNVWYVARSTPSGSLYIIATTTEHASRELVDAMNTYSPGKAAEPSEVIDQRTNYKTPWAERSSQSRKVA